MNDAYIFAAVTVHVAHVHTLVSVSVNTIPHISYICYNIYYENISLLIQQRSDRTCVANCYCYSLLTKHYICSVKIIMYILLHTHNKKEKISMVFEYYNLCLEYAYVNLSQLGTHDSKNQGP